MKPSRRNMKKITQRHIIIKLLKTSYKEKIFKADKKTGKLGTEEQ